MRADFDNSAMGCFPVGTEVIDHHGNRWLVTGVHAHYLGLKRSTWLGRLFCRLLRLLARGMG